MADVIMTLSSKGYPIHELLAKDLFPMLASPGVLQHPGRMMERNLWYWLVMMLNLAVSDMFEDMCGYLMMNRDDRGSWRRLSYNTVVRRLPWPEGLMLMSMKGT